MSRSGRCLYGAVMLALCPTLALAQPTPPGPVSEGQSSRLGGDTISPQCRAPADEIQNSEPVAPQEWAQRLLGTCLLEQQRWEESLAALEAELIVTAQSEEQLAFPEVEREARRRSLEEERRTYFARLNHFLLGEKAGSFQGPAGRYRRAAARLSWPRGKNPLRRSLGLLFAEATPCALNGVESALLFAIFDLPFTRPGLEADLGIEHAYGELQRAYHARLEKVGSLEEVYRTLRPQDPEVAFRYLDELTARLALTESPPQAADAQQPEASLDPTPRQDEATLPPIELPGGQAERRALVQKLQHHFRAAAEPIRIQAYLRAKVEELQGALRITIPEEATEKLFARAGQAFYPTEKALWRLAETPPGERLFLLERILDAWFHKHALPAVQKALARDPFSAYWFFVQSGGVSRGPVAFRGSRVEVGPEALELESLKALSFREAVSHLRQAGLPPDFVDAHAALERAFTEVTLARDATLQQMDAIELSRKERAKLDRHLAALDERETFSTLDVYAWVVRDANRIGGRADWDLVRAALRLLLNAKREGLEQEVARLVESARAEDAARLASYLGTLTELMLELEQRQATEQHFQEATGGGVTRWFLRDFLMSPGMPIQLWAPEGITGQEFQELMDAVAPMNPESGNRYQGKPATEVRLVHDGREFHHALVEVIDTAGSFLNIASFDWKLDQGGEEIAYRIMAKKLGIEGDAYERFLATFRQGLPLAPGADVPTLFYDIPPSLMKNLLVYFFFATTDVAAVTGVRRELEQALGGELTCPSVLTCGDLAQLQARAGSRYDPRRAAEPGYRKAWEAYRNLEALFEEKEVVLRETRPRSALADYVADGDCLRRLVLRYGRKRADDPQQPLPINIIVDGKQNITNTRLGQPSRQFPYFYSNPYWDLYMPLFEFDVRVLLWKGLIEFPWHLGPLPLPGRKMFGILPVPYLPYPWLGLLPGFGWAGTTASLLLQHLLATDSRKLWAMTMHAKNMSSESVALETGMGIGSKYFNAYPEFSIWHDMGVRVKGPIVGDANDHFVQLFNYARVNNAGLPRARGVEIPRLRYEDYRYPGPSSAGDRAWVMTTDPENQDYNYRGVFLAALAAARKNIYVQNAFFTDPLVPRMLLRKAQEFRGRVRCAGIGESACAEKQREAVAIYLVLPDSTDQPILDMVSSVYLHEMLHQGIKVYRWNPQRGWAAKKMLHTKAWLIDYEEGSPALTYVGSANTTQRSHLTDNEMGIVSTSPEFAREVYERLFRPDLTTDARLQSAENFPLAQPAKRLARSGRWLRHLLVNLLWFF